jgi:hypothetical protein
MTPEDQDQLQQCVETIASILYRNTPAEQLQTLENTVDLTNKTSSAIR